MTWTAAAYAEFDKARRDEFLGYARHGLACLDTVMRDREHGGFHWIVEPSGKVDAGLGDEKHVYGISFVIYAASKLRDVAGDDLALKVARDAFDWLEAHAHDAEPRRLLRGPASGTEHRSSPGIEHAADRPPPGPPGGLLRVQDDELAHPHARGPGRAFAGRSPGRSSRNGSARSS